MSSPVDGLEPEPAAAATLFGDRLDVVRQYTHDLAEFGEELGLIGPLEIPRLWTRHVINSGLLAPLLVEGRVGDIGSGAGLPGLVLAAARPDAHLVLIEPMERRVEWLQAETSRLGLTNVEIVRARAEEAKITPYLDQITARAVSALSKLIPIAAPLVKTGGEVIFLKGARVAEEVSAARKVIAKNHLVDVEILELGTGLVEETTRVFRATVD
ncbi:16S rRNA (guanine(527)-N(7))-methyltransferase RsmG [Frondihabitans australicus]|uniref:Ribosomal RNA small subunit methyltransferase G n=1 Tax=Frondihabitans australicus TaxID=386892 RepID=A0A495IIM0_9MICO|nr:16S rRNA (guanine(527)-N(7))-methyltransferase RsmG [Frondihabitans australicus]RKR75833.1 16S rRNA m(7)G-527 methyltransferase [Frondihabitans australicus]